MAKHYGFLHYRRLLRCLNINFVINVIGCFPTSAIYHTARSSACIYFLPMSPAGSFLSDLSIVAREDRRANSLSIPGPGSSLNLQPRGGRFIAIPYTSFMTYKIRIHLFTSILGNHTLKRAKGRYGKRNAGRSSENLYRRLWQTN